MDTIPQEIIHEYANLGGKRRRQVADPEAARDGILEGSMKPSN